MKSLITSIGKMYEQKIVIWGSNFCNFSVLLGSRAAR